jgi:hypothetical protein
MSFRINILETPPLSKYSRLFRVKDDCWEKLD